MNPSAVIPKQATVFSSSTSDLSDVKQLLQRQLQIAGSLQEVLISNGHNLDVKELKELASTASSI
ncbi:MAG: hypothetical protein EOL89_14670, partial [Actinobacteria bacterium]|nr:hypothetical protein [Actinomycetota bacterium]